MDPLELANFPVEALRFGSVSSYSARALEVSERELTEVVLRDPRILAADLAIVHPGESVRVTGIRDVVEPRVVADDAVA